MPKHGLQPQNSQDATDNGIEPKHHETPVYQLRGSFSILEIAAFAALFMGMFRFAQNGDLNLFIFGCILAAVKEGPSVVKSLVLLIREKFSSYDSKKL